MEQSLVKSRYVYQPSSSSPGDSSNIVNELIDINGIN